MVQRAATEAQEAMIKQLSTAGNSGSRAILDIETAQQKCTDALAFVADKVQRIRKGNKRIATLTKALDNMEDNLNEDGQYDEDDTKTWKTLSERKKQLSRDTTLLLDFISNHQLYRWELTGIHEN